MHADVLLWGLPQDLNFGNHRVSAIGCCPCLTGTTVIESHVSRRLRKQLRKTSPFGTFDNDNNADLVRIHCLDILLMISDKNLMDGISGRFQCCRGLHLYFQAIVF